LVSGGPQWSSKILKVPAAPLLLAAYIPFVMFNQKLGALAKEVWDVLPLPLVGAG